MQLRSFVTSPWKTFSGSGGNREKKPSFTRYLNRSKIGEGAFASVYYALDPQTRLPVALKKINLDAIEDELTLQTTKKELELYKQLEKHPNIVQCYKAFEEHEKIGHGCGKMLRRNLILVLEYVDGGDLEQWLQHQVSRGLRRGLLDERLIWHLFSQIANGLTYIHGRKIIHRDFKPANVLLTQRMEVKLTDFGLSRQNRNTGAKTVCGTPYYMAPERIAERGYSYMSDVWSLGCILYEMAAMGSPFLGEKENVTSLVDKIRNADYPPIPDDCYSDQMLMLIDACLNPIAIDRPTAREVFYIAYMMNARVTT